MSLFVVLIDFTEKGAQAIKDTGKRATAFVEKAKGLGVTVKEIYWTLGGHDGVIILEAPDDESATAAVLSLSAQGNVKTRTLRAFGKKEIEAILAR